MSYEEFVRELTAASSNVQATYQAVVNDWRPESPPVTVLFGYLGDQIADDFSHVGIDVNRRIFSLVEQAMESRDQRLLTATATGLIEALANRAGRTRGQWEQIVPLLGPRSLHHAEAWLGF
ncbi:hypothetical protein LQG66_32225 [Bradyrhizobium ontarionense]|uniref:DUF7674 domain-containing protein n=1 Tax=Bradyrhizobium ontarionense TaxID=2898149 RepID=A0ABY3R8Y5_9BRAD|nr:hypothetical protein [Bradyrhizobium sp. A19]UFZ03819.1 hypothetical protein LQG66_32225 [Bradyrhizobium sp. A19]